LIFFNFNKIKQRILDRLNESVESILGKDHHLNEETDLIDNENQATGLNKRQKEILSIISKYVDFYHSNLSVKHDAETKFAYAIHALNHVLKYVHYFFLKVNLNFLSN
jgi:septum formation topological specificity factor MinE